MTVLHLLQVIARRFQESDQGRDTHVSFGHRFHARNSCARNTGTLGKLFLTETGLAAGFSQHIGDISKCGHCSPRASLIPINDYNVALEAQNDSQKVE